MFKEPGYRDLRVLRICKGTR